MFTRVLSLVVFSLIGWGFFHLYYKTAAGFSLSEITSELQLPASYKDPALTDAEVVRLREILNQPFHYLGKGCQCFVFESQDGSYVIKLLKHKHLRTKKEKLEQLLDSSSLAYKELKQDSALVCLHFECKPLTGSVVSIKDKIGIVRKLDIDSYEFLVQRKGRSLASIFSDVTTKQEAQDKINLLIDLIRTRQAKGIADRDRAFAVNVGFCEDENKAFFVDFGQFYKDENLRNPEVASADMMRHLKNLSEWMGIHCPQFIPLVEQEIWALQSCGIAKDKSARR